MRDWEASTVNLAAETPFPFSKIYLQNLQSTELINRYDDPLATKKNPPSRFIAFLLTVVSVFLGLRRCTPRDQCRVDISYPESLH
jgi:hypothetical protein